MASVELAHGYGTEAMAAKAAHGAEAREGPARPRWLLGAGLALAGVEGVAALIGPMTLYAAAVGVSMPAAQAGAIGAVEGLSGTASGLSGFLGTALGAAATQAVGALSDGSGLPVSLGVAALAALAAAAPILLRGTEGGRP